MTDIPTLVREASNDINTLNRDQPRPIFTEQLCCLCNAAMELGDKELATCSQCGMTDQEAKATNGTRPAAPQPVTTNVGWYLESAADRGNEIYVDIPKTANNHIKVPQSNDVKQDLGMPRRKPKDIGDFIRESEKAKKEEAEAEAAKAQEATQQAAGDPQDAEQANEPPKAEDAASEAPAIPQAQGTPPRRKRG